MSKNFSLFRLSLASPELTLAAPHRNLSRHTALIEEAARQGSSLILFPELSLCGATCGQALGQEQLLEGCEEALIGLLGVSAQYPQLAIVVGSPLRRGGRLFNAAVLLLGGRFVGAAAKFSSGGERGLRDSKLFSRPSADEDEVIRLRGHEIPLGTNVFRLNWGHDSIALGLLPYDDLSVPSLFSAAAREADLLLCPAARPLLIESGAKLSAELSQKSLAHHTAIAVANTGCGESGQDEVFAGGLWVYEDGQETAREKEAFKPVSQLLHTYVDVAYLRYRKRLSASPEYPELAGFPLSILEMEGPGLKADLPPAGLRAVDPYPFIPSDEREIAERAESILNIQAAGLARRLRQIRCERVVLGVSGGLDSTLALLASVRALELLGLGPEHVLAVTLPGFGTSDETHGNATALMEVLGVEWREISIVPAVLQHFTDIGHDPAVHDVTYENAQARERTQILMDIANKLGGILVGTGDLSEFALGWCTYSGDHMSMYAVNATVPKTLIRPILKYEGECYKARGQEKLADILRKISETPVSPELLPPDPSGKIAQKTEDIVGPYVLHDFFVYHMLRRGASPEKILWLAEYAFGPEGCAEEKFDAAELSARLKFFLKRFFTQQFKRNCSADGAGVGSIGFSPRQGFYMPSDADMSLWTDSI